MISEKPLLRALNGEATPVPPIWLMRQAGRYLPEYRELRAQAGSFLDLCFTPELATEVTLQPIRRFGLDGAILFSDILVVPHALGQELWFEEGVGPRLKRLESAEDIDRRLAPDGLHDRLAPVYETLRRVKAALPAETTLLGFAGAPWTVASYMLEGGSSRDFALAKHWAYGDPDGFGRLVDLLVDATADYLNAQIAAGAEAVQIFDSWAGSLPSAQMRKWCLDPAKALIAKVKARNPDVPVILFPRGAGPFYEAFAAESGADVLGLDTALPPEWARDRLQGRVGLQGNLDPLHLVVGGQSMRQAARSIVQALSGGPYVFNLGHGVVPQTPPEHVAELVACVREGTS
ncbi:uroporphyrinogen decarboxylase [Ferruginivarius sediminum]|uniref:Uroporphyrinogen decarboxylase n=1 Tax=Ferruginivarius sediminum TaxID=2661937 RepID=A0A369TGK6_9PROT|nr:uroporphyrinogen decarboxylase [Ferruginivarius sediminum]RDD63267.1 uroporphyrinogen decarboxylase [Ferruginivarius sediminum]